jgi:hypothetical protein
MSLGLVLADGSMADSLEARLAAWPWFQRVTEPKVCSV